MPNLMPPSMALPIKFFLVIFLSFTSTLINTILAFDPNNPNKVPFACLHQANTCKSILYQSNGLSKEQISNYYLVNVSQIQAIGHGNDQNYLVTVPCSCQNMNNTVAYFYDALYTVQLSDTFPNVSDSIYSGQAWAVGNEKKTFKAGLNITMHLLCGCAEKDSQVMVTYTVQQQDTLSDIANLLSAEVDEIENTNKDLLQKPGYIEAGWVLFVPSYKNRVPPPPGAAAG